MKNVHFKYFLAVIFSILVLFTCKKGAIITTEPSGETRLLKISVKETTISKGDVIVTVGDRVFQKENLVEVLEFLLTLLLILCLKLQ